MVRSRGAEIRQSGLHVSESEISAEELRSSVRGFLSKEFSLERRRCLTDGSQEVRGSLQSAAAELGWFGLSIPERYGGTGLDLAHSAVLYEELGASLAPLPLAGSALTAQLILGCAEDTAKERFLPAIATGERMGTLDCSAFSHFRLGYYRGEWVLSGHTATLLDGDGATLLLLRAIDEGKEERWILLDAQQRGFRVRGVSSIDQTRSFGTFTAEDLILGAAEVLDVPPNVGAAVTEHAYLAIASDAVGGAGAILEITLEYLRTRRQFDRPIGSFQALKHRCADHRIRMDQARALLKRAIAQSGRTDGGSHLDLSPLAKAICCDEYARVAADCLQLHGGIGFTWEHPCHLYLRRAKLNQHLFGRSADCLDRAAMAFAASSATSFDV